MAGLSPRDLTHLPLLLLYCSIMLYNIYISLLSYRTHQSIWNLGPPFLQLDLSTLTTTMTNTIRANPCSNNAPRHVVHADAWKKRKVLMVCTTETISTTWLGLVRSVPPTNTAFGWIEEIQPEPLCVSWCGFFWAIRLWPSPCLPKQGAFRPFWASFTIFSVLWPWPHMSRRPWRIREVFLLRQFLPKRNDERTNWVCVVSAKRSSRPFRITVEFAIDVLVKWIVSLYYGLACLLGWLLLWWLFCWYLNVAYSQWLWPLHPPSSPLFMHSIPLHSDHCPWMNNCIGAGNMKHFFLFLIYTWSCSVFSLILLGWNYFFCASEDCTFTLVLTQLVRIMTVLSAGAFLFTSSMLMNVLYGLLTGIGTIDRLKKKATDTMDTSEEEPIPLTDIFGIAPFWQWPLPTDPIFDDHDRVMGFSTSQRLLREQILREQDQQPPV